MRKDARTKRIPGPPARPKAPGPKPPQAPATTHEHENRHPWPAWFEAAFCALALALLLAYFARPAVWREHWAAAREWRATATIPAPPRPLTPQDLRDILGKTAPNPLEMLLAREILAAWQMRERFPRAFQAMVAAIGTPGTGATTLDSYSLVLEEHEARWQRARKLAAPAEARIDPAPGRGFDIVFPEGTRTADVGTRLEVELRLDNAAPLPPGFHPLAAWTTSALPQPDSRRLRQLLVETAPGSTTATLILDLGSEPAWRHPQSQARAIQVSLEPLKGWAVVAIRLEE